MTTIKLFDNITLQIDTDDTDYFDMMVTEFTRSVQGFMFMPQYKSGVWNGKVCMIDKFRGTFPYGILMDYIRIHKKMFPRKPLTITPEVKALFKGPKIDIKYELKLKPRDYQIDCIEAALKHSKGIIRSATACHIKGDKVLLYTGKFENIENIKFGDYVIGKDGLPKRVLNIFNGIDDLYKIDPKNKRESITVTKNHLLHLGFTHRGKYDNRKGTFENISVKDYLSKTKTYKHVSKLSYSNKEINFEYKKTLCKLSPYFIGLYLGDGGKHVCSVTNVDKEVIDKIYEEAKNFHMEVKIKPCSKYGYYIIGSKNRRNKIFKEFENLGIIFGRKNRCACEDRFIPKIVFNQNIKYRKEVLAGLIDSDGGLENGTYYEFCSKSEKLRNDTALLSISLGLVCSKTEKIVNRTKYYRLNIMGNISKIPVRIERKKQIKKSNTYAYRSAFNVKYIGKDNFYGIQVEGGLYITNDGMITHNSGKSLVIAYIIKNLLDDGNVQKCIIIVPTTALIAQFIQDLIDYGFDPNKIGMVFAERKQWDREITISTWQSLSRNHKKLDMYDCIIVDETHQSKSLEIKKILQKAKKAKYRLGFTGTMHSDELNNWNTKAYLGPIIREYSSGFLADEGYISKAVIHMMNIEYKDKWSGNYHELRDSIFQNEFRLELIKTLVNDLDHNVLILVDKVEKEGEFLKDYLKDVNKEVVFLSGKDKVDVREMWRLACMKRKDIALIATYGIFQMGVNIPNLQNIILASPFKAKIRVLQSIGRALRKHADKMSGAQIFDIHDHIKYFEKYGDIRLRHYDSEGFKVYEHIYHEGTEINFT